MAESKHSSAIAVDIGCTRTHVGLVDTARYRCLDRYDCRSQDIPLALPGIIDKIKAVARNFRTFPVIIAGGRGDDAIAVEAALRKQGAASIAHVRYHKKLPISFRYKTPETLGADRIADALYAAAVYQGRNVIIIDSGTAITVDLVNRDGEFSGGAIIAGIEAQLRILHLSTGRLPLLSAPAHAIKLPGTSTESCMQAGTVYGIAGAMNQLVRRYQKSVEGKCLVLATGGAWHITERLVDFNFTEVPDMTLIGTALYR